ncbi:MAG: magnesium/cobalt transporter CorA [Pseudomonadota bacterium]
MLINCVAYQEGKKLSDITVEAISDYIQMPECFVWVALREPEAQELAVMKEEFSLHELAVEDAERGQQRPKIEEYGDSLFVVVRTIEMVDGEIHEGELDIFVAHNYVLSVRNNVKLGFLGVRARAEREPQLLAMGSSFVLYALMDAVVDRYFPVLVMLESELEKIEDRIFIKGSQRDNIERLYELKRKVLILRHAVVPLLDALGKLHGGRVPMFCIDTQDYFRDVHDHLQRINAAIDTMRETISTAIQVNLSMVTIDEGEVNKRLAAWAAIFGVFTAFAGVWGMNFTFMPELQSHWGYPAALTFMFSLSGYLYYRFRKSGWL